MTPRIKFQSILQFDTKDLQLEAQFNELLYNYSRRWRTYHNYEHIMSMLDAITPEIKEDLTEDELRILQTAIIFHDVIYIPGSKSSEDASADFARMFLNRAGWNEKDVKKVSILIKETKFYPDLSFMQFPFISNEFQNLITIIQDLDLLGFAYDEERFDINQQNVFDELSILKYEGSPENNFYKNIEESMSKGRLMYRTKYFKHLNEKAHSNIKRIIKELEDGN